jgi:methyltransferase (TIGR00027 family)
MLPPGLGELNDEMMEVLGLPKKWAPTVSIGEEMVAPYKSLGVAARKEWFNRAIRRALVQGAKQCISLGAGFDLQFAMLAKEHPEVRFIEVDIPFTAELKLEYLKKVGLDHPNLNVVGLDLRDGDLMEILKIDWDPRVKSVVVMEGLLMYLTPKEVTGLLEGATSIVPKGSVFLFTYLGGEPSKLRMGVLHGIGEPFLWTTDADSLDKMLVPPGLKIMPNNDMVWYWDIERYVRAIKEG